MSISSVNSYYQLSSLQTGTQSGGSSSSTGATTSGSTTASLVQTLADALSGSSSSSGSGSDPSAYLLDLSPSAQALLGGATSSGSGAASTSTTFTLSAAQESKIEAIIAKYKNAPYDQATFDSIQKDLQAAGLSPEQLSAQDQVQSFNSTSILLGALNGNYANVNTPSTTQSGEQTKSNNYMESILSDWKSVSTTAATNTSSASGSASSGGTSLLS